MTKFLTALMLFLGLAFAGTPLMAQCKGCDSCGDKKTEKKESEKCCEEEGKGCCEKGDAKDCGGCGEVKANSFVVTIEGMTCVKCAKAVEKAIAAIDGVESVKVCDKSGKALVTMKEGKTLDKTAVETALKETEFKTKSVVKAEPKKDENKEAKTEEKSKG